MKISQEWIGEYLPGPLEPEAAAHVLTHGGFPVEGIETIGNDTVLDVEVTSNRGDCLSHVGVARELAALMSREFRGVTPGVSEAGTSAASATSVQIEALDLCPHYTARVIRGVKVGPSPDWLARRLEAVGLRPINNVVDVTNYVMFELGQPLHAFDFDKLEGGRIIVRRARRGEKITSIDGRERELAENMLVIADAARPVALAGVMGGKDSEVSDRTVNVLLESARFDPLSVRTTARALAMRSDSSYRFERGIDPLLPERASLRAAHLILQTGGGEVLLGVAEAGASGWQPKKLTLRVGRLRAVLGVELPIDAVAGALARLQLAPVLRGDHIEVTVPSHRLDLNLEIDLVEEVARVVGYDRVPVRDQVEVRLQPIDPAAKATETIRAALVGSGYFESITVGFVSDLLAKDFVPPEASPQTPLARTSPQTRKEDANLRPSILPSLLESVRHNEKQGIAGARLFEIGSTFWNDPSGKVDERRRVTLVGPGDVRVVRGAVESLLRRLNAERAVTVTPENRPGFARGASGRVMWGNEPVGYIGRIARSVADKLDLREIPAAAELELAPLLAGTQLVPQLRPLPKYPAVRRDVSFVLSDDVRFDALASLVRKVQPAHLEDLEYVTTYRGKPLEKGTKSVTITLVFRSPAETLTSEQVEASVGKVIDAAKAELKATLRT